jgi:hypothetical protein
MAGRMLIWSLELSEFDICYESRKALKAQFLADFVAEMTAFDEENSNNELIVPMSGLTPSSRWKVQAARIGLSDEPFPADSSSKTPRIQRLCSKNT